AWRLPRPCTATATPGTTPPIARHTAHRSCCNQRILPVRAFSSEVDTGSREENASKQESRASVLIQSEPNQNRICASPLPVSDRTADRQRPQVAGAGIH